MIGSTSSGDWPGSSLRSTTSSTVPGITLRRSEASIIVGASVKESSGSIVSTASRSTSASLTSTSSGRGCSPSTASRKPATSGPIEGSGRYAASLSISGAALTSALSAIPGSDAWPLRPCTVIRIGALIFSAVAQR